ATRLRPIRNRDSSPTSPCARYSLRTLCLFSLWMRLAPYGRESTRAITAPAAGNLRQLGEQACEWRRGHTCHGADEEARRPNAKSCNVRVYRRGQRLLVRSSLQWPPRFQRRNLRHEQTYRRTSHAAV